MIRLSICIPTYNRSKHLANCLRSIAGARARARCEIEVCVSDNASTDDTPEVVRRAQSAMAIKYRRNERNLGIPRNFLNVVAMAEGEFAWLIGDDDLLLPDALTRLCDLLEQQADVDFFYVNSAHCTTEHVLSFPQPFDVANLPAVMPPFSPRRNDGPLPFFDLIDPEVSFDFLGGMFLSVFRRSAWMQHRDALDADAIADPRTFSSFDNTFPHVKIFARAFARARAYFVARPLSVCLVGAREWAPMYPLVRSVRLVEALEEYRRQGLPLIRYLRARNFALRTFLSDVAYMYVHRATSGVEYLRPGRLLLRNAVFPNLYLSVVYYVIRKTRGLVARLGGARDAVVA